MQTGQTKQAEKTLRAALAERQDHPETLHNLARVLMDTQRFDDAKPLLEKAVTLQPDQPSFLRNLGVVLLSLGESKAAVETLQRAVAVDESSPETWCDLGLAFSQLDNDTKAADAFDKALSLDREHARARHNRGHLRLRQKDFAAGWEDYEARRLDPKAGFEVRPFDVPEWGGENISDKTLLVWGEQGLGDHILHAGMVSELSQRVGHLVFECEPRLVAVFKRSFPNATVIPQGAAHKDVAPDVHCPSGSLGRWLRPTGDSFKPTSSYLVADTDKLERTSALLNDRFGQCARIGVSWKSARARFGAFKSSELHTDWTPVFDAAPGAAIVSLQYGDVGQDLEKVIKIKGVKIHHDVGVDVTHDLDGLAALISSLDLVITTSNTTAHLSGALGVPTWVLVPRGPARLWYWFNGEADSPWYPCVSLYWLDTAGQWRDPMNRIADDLNMWIQGKQSMAAP